MPALRIAILHDFFTSIGGGEKLTLELARALKADIITTDIDRQNWSRLQAHDIAFRSVGETIRFPILKQIHASWLFARSKMEYDVYILSGNWCIFAARRHHPNLLYCHTPVRMFYSHFWEFFRVCPWYAKPVFMLWALIHKVLLEARLLDINAIVTNSKNTKKRIKKYYKRDATVIYPPIRQYKHIRYGSFWLSVNRLYPHKRIELQIEAFRKLPDQQLWIVGGYAQGDHAHAYVKRIMKDLPKNVRFLGEIDESLLAELYGSCKGFIATSVDEDFGMNVLEAMSAGKSVVAVNEGGYTESVKDGKTGLLVEAKKDAIIKAVQSINKNPGRWRKACERRAAEFSEERFKRQMSGAVAQVVRKYHRLQKA